MNVGALDGIKIFEFASYVSGPFAGMLLADLGAEVVKISHQMAAMRSVTGASRTTTARLAP